MPDDPFDFSGTGDDAGDGEPDETGADGAGDNPSFKALRQAFKRQEKQIKALEKEIEPLREYKTTTEAEKRGTAIEAAFKEVGLKPEHAELFSAVNPEAEVTAESVQAFAAKYGLATVDGSGVGEPGPSDAAGFAPVTTGTTPGSNTMTHEQAMELVRQGRADEVNRAREQGRLLKEVPPWPS